MSATYEFERRAAERAELEHLLVRLQEAHVDVDLLDPVRRKWNDLYGYFRVSSKDLAKTCEALLNAGLPTFVGKHEDCKTELEVFIGILLTQTDFQSKEGNVEKTASKWEHLNTLLDTYEKDRTIASNDKTDAVAKIATLRKQMKTYESYWPKPFKKVAK